MINPAVPMRPTRCRPVLFAVLAASLMSTAAHANLLLNGGFESPPLGTQYAAYDHGNSIGGSLGFGTGFPTVAQLTIRADYQEYAGALSFSPHGGLVSLRRPTK